MTDAFHFFLILAVPCQAGFKYVCLCGVKEDQWVFQKKDISSFVFRFASCIELGINEITKCKVVKVV